MNFPFLKTTCSSKKITSHRFRFLKKVGTAPQVFRNFVFVALQVASHADVFSLVMSFSWSIPSSTIALGKSARWCIPLVTGKKKTKKKRTGIKIRVTVVEALKKRTFFPKLYFFLYNSVKSVKSAYLSLCKRAKFGLLNDFTHFGLTYPFSFSQNSRYFALFAHLYTNVCSFKKACFCVSSALKQPNTLMEVTVAEDFSFPFTRNVFFSKRCVFERLSFLNRFW